MKLELVLRIVSLAFLCGGCGTAALPSATPSPGAKLALFHALVGDTPAAVEEAAPSRRTAP